MPDTDPNQVRLTGENSFIRLLEAADGPQLTRRQSLADPLLPSRCGACLFIESDVTDGAVRVYSDNEAMTRWLQGEIESLLYPAFRRHSPGDQRDVRQRGRHPHGLDGDSSVGRGRPLADLVRLCGAVCPDRRRRERRRASPRRLQLLHSGPRRACGAQWSRRARAAVPPAAGRPGREHRLPGPVRDLGSPLTA